MSEQIKRIRRLLFHPEYAGSDPEYALSVARQILGRKIMPSDLEKLSAQEANKLEKALKERFQSSFKAVVKSL